jgi:hypothetical protein
MTPLGRPSAKSVLASAAVFAAGATLRAQVALQPDEGPIIVGERKQPWKTFELTRFGAGLEFYGESRVDTLKPNNGNSTVDRQNTLREILDFDVGAFIGHKNLVDFNGRFRIGNEDRYLDYETVRETAHEGNFYNLYDVSALILGASRLPTTVYTRRDQENLDRAFAPPLTSTVSETGIIANLVSDFAPTTLHYFHNDSEQVDDLGDADYHQVTDSVSLNSNILINDKNRGEVDFSFDSVDETQANGYHNPYDRTDLNLTETYTFGGPKRHELRSYARYYDQTGLNSQEILRFDEQLLLQHASNLQSRYNLTAERQVISGLEQWLIRGNANVRHQLFESLVSTGSLTGEGFSIPGEFRSNQWSLQGGLEYTKRVGPGRLDSSVGATFTAQHNGDRGSDITVLNEAHVVNQPFPVVIDRRNIVSGSITVSSSTGFPVYSEGPDYTVAYFSDRAEITVIIGGNIIDGQTVLVDYTVGPEPSSDINSINTTVSVRYTLTEGMLDSLAFYTIYRTQNFDISTANPELFTLDDYDDLLYGIEYRKFGFHLLTEWNIHDSTTNPYDGTRLEASYDYRIGPESTLSLELSRQLINYEDPDNDVVLDRVTGRWSQRFSREWSTELRLDFFNESNEIEGQSRGFDQYLEVHWKRGRTTAYTTISNQFNYADPSDSTSQSLEIGLRRQF